MAFGGWLGEPRPRWRLIGLAGAALLAAGAVGVGVHPRPDPWAVLRPVWALRSEPAGVAVSLAAAGVGVALLVLAWARLRRLVEALPESAAVRWWSVTTALWALPLAIAPPLFSRDVYSYAAQGELAVAGLDPYTEGPAVLTSPWLESVSPAWRDTPAPYGPLFLLLALGAVWVSGGNLVAAVLLLRLVAVAGIVLVAVSLPRLARALGGPGSNNAATAVWLGLASPLLVLHAVSGAHNDALMLGLVVAGLAFAVERRVALGLVLLALAVAVKATALVVVPFAALLWAARMPSSRRGVRVVQACAAAVAVVGAAFAAVTLAGGFGVGWVGALETPGRSVQWTSLPTGLGIAIGWVANAVGLGVDTSVTVAVCRAVGMAAMLALLVWLWWSVRHADDEPRRVVEHAGWALLAVALLSPAFHPWYLPTAVTVLAVAVVRRRVLAGLAVASGALCFLVLPDGFNLARVTLPVGVALDVAVLVAGAVLGVRWARSAAANGRHRDDLGVARHGVAGD